MCQLVQVKKLELEASTLGGFLTILGNILRVTQEAEASGWIRFALTTTSLPLISGDVLSRSFWDDKMVPADYVIMTTGT